MWVLGRIDLYERVKWMDLLFEIIFELIVEGSIEISSNKKVSKWIRYPLIAILAVLFGGVILVLFVVGIGLLHENVVGSIFFIAVDVFVLIGSIVKFKKIYLSKK